MIQWEIKKLSELAVVNEKNIDRSYPHTEIEYIDIASVDKGRILGAATISRKDAPSRAQRIVKDNDILLSTVRPNLKHFAFVKKANPNTIASTGFAVISAKEIDPYFLYCYLTTDKYTGFLTAIADAHTSTYPAFNPDVLENSDVFCPPIEDQRRIGKILADLDAKIELNHRMNETLGVMAQVLFKEWFVDFKFPGHEKAKIVDGLPEGWRTGTLSDVCEIIMGQSPPGETYNESGSGLPFYQGNRDFGYRFPTARVFCSVPTRFADTGDVLISVRAPVGALNMAHERCCIGRGVAALRMKNHSNGFLFYFLSTQHDLWDRFNSEGTVFGCLNKAEFKKINLVIPSEVAIRKFDEFVIPIEELVWKNEQEIRCLLNLRNCLLPRLVTGGVVI